MIAYKIILQDRKWNKSTDIRLHRYQHTSKNSNLKIKLNQPVFIIQNKNISLVEWIPFAVDLNQSGSSFALDLEQAAIVKFICFDFIESTSNTTFLILNPIRKVTHEFLTFMMLSLTKLNWLTTKPIIQMCCPNRCAATFIDFLGYNINHGQKCQKVILSTKIGI